MTAMPIDLADGVEPASMARGRTGRESRVESCMGCAARSVGIGMKRRVAGETQIDTANALDMSYLGFFQEMAELGAKAMVV